MLPAMNRPSTAAALAFTAALFAAGDASADTRSWTAVKKVLGKGDAAVVGIDLAAVRGTASFKAGLQLMLSAEAEFASVLDTVKAECGFDMMATVSDLTVVFERGGEKPLIAFGLDGLDEARVVDCLGKVAGKMTNNPAPKLVGKKIGKITEYSVAGESKKLYAAWLAKDVLVFTEDANDRKGLERRVGGKGASPALKKLLARTTPTAPFWFAVAVNEKEDGRTIVGGYGKVELAAGVFKGAGAMVMAKPAEATGAAAEANEGLAAAKTELAGQKVVELSRALGTVVIAASGAEINITGSVPDKDMPAIVGQMDKAF